MNQVTFASVLDAKAVQQRRHQQQAAKRAAELKAKAAIAAATASVTAEEETDQVTSSDQTLGALNAAKESQKSALVALQGYVDRFEKAFYAEDLAKDLTCEELKELSRGLGNQAEKDVWAQIRACGMRLDDDLIEEVILTERLKAASKANEIVQAQFGLEVKREQLERAEAKLEKHHRFLCWNSGKIGYLQRKLKREGDKAMVYKAVADGVDSVAFPTE